MAQAVATGVGTGFAILEGQQFMSLTTFRKNGDGVSTPVWFAEKGGKLYVYTQASSGKVKRLRHTSRVTVAPCDRSGKLFGTATAAGTARLLDNASEQQAADAALNAKYGFLKRMMSFVSKLRGSESAYIEIVPA